MPSTFINERLNEGIEQGASGGPTFLTTIMALAGGGEKRNIEWSMPRQEWDLSYGIQSPADLDDVYAMFYNCYGRAIGFRFKDWSDYQIGSVATSTAQGIGTGDASNTAFQVYKAYTLGSDTFLRKITRLVSGTLHVYVGGVLKTETTDYTVSYDTGVITFVTAPGSGASVAIIAEFDVPVRFDSDSLKKKVTWVGAEEIPSIPIIELKE